MYIEWPIQVKVYQDDGSAKVYHLACVERTRHSLQCEDGKRQNTLLPDPSGRGSLSGQVDLIRRVGGFDLGPDARARHASL